MTSGRGHTPQDPGAKAIVDKNGLVFGTIGGGKVEAKAIAYAQDVLASGKAITPQTFTWNLQRDIGMSCGGEGTYLFELYNSKNWEVAVFGAGHVAQALTRTLTNLECKITCVDARQEWIDQLPQLHNLTALCVPNPADFVKTLNTSTYFVVMTQGHAFDVPILYEIFKEFPDAPYVGVIGSHPKALKIKNELKEKGISEELLTRLRCPMGLDLGNNQPFEISISITGELIQVRDRLLKLSTADSNRG